MADMKVNGAAVKAIRTAQGRSLRDVAEKSSLDHGYLARVEAGARGATEETIGSIAQALGTEVAAISYPDVPIVQATPETVARITECITEFLLAPVEATS